MTSTKGFCLLSKVDPGENIPKSHVTNLEGILECPYRVKKVEVKESGSGEALYFLAL